MEIVEVKSIATAFVAILLFRLEDRLRNILSTV